MLHNDHPHILPDIPKPEILFLLTYSFCLSWHETSSEISQKSKRTKFDPLSRPFFLSFQKKGEEEILFMSYPDIFWVRSFPCSFFSWSYRNSPFFSHERNARRKKRELKKRKEFMEGIKRRSLKITGCDTKRIPDAAEKKFSETFFRKKNRLNFSLKSKKEQKSMLWKLWSSQSSSWSPQITVILLETSKSQSKKETFWNHTSEWSEWTWDSCHVS